MTANPGKDGWPEWPVCTLDAIEPVGALGFLVGDGDWPFRGFVVRAGDEWRAYANICPHKRHPLDAIPDNFLAGQGKYLHCGSHGALFDPASGECVFGPCLGARLLSLPLRISERGEVYVRAPDNLQEGLAYQAGEEGFGGTN